MADLTEIASHTCLPSWRLSARKRHTEQVFSIGPKSLSPGGRTRLTSVLMQVPSEKQATTWKTWLVTSIPFKTSKTKIEACVCKAGCDSLTTLGCSVKVSFNRIPFGRPKGQKWKDQTFLRLKSPKIQADFALSSSQ